MSARPPKYDWPIKWPEKEKLTSNWLGLILFLATFATIVPAIWVIVRFYGALIIGDDEAVRNIGLIFLAVLGAPFVIWRAIVAQGNLDRSKDRDYADLFTKAVEQLGATREVRVWDEKTQRDIYRHDPNIEVRLGAIYALGKIGQDSPKDFEAVYSTLCAYVRVQSPAEKPDRSTLTKQSIPTDLEKDIDLPRVDIATALNVICTRGKCNNLKPEFTFDLSRTKLQRADFNSCDLAQFDFSGATLDYANFTDAYFQSATMKGVKGIHVNFVNAVFENTTISNASLQFAKFERASLTQISAHSTDFRFSGFRQSKITNSDFSGTNISSSDFSKIVSDGIFLSGATLNNANFMDSELRNGVFHKAKAQKINLIGSTLANSEFSECNLQEARLHGVDFSNTSLEIMMIERALITMAKFPEKVPMMVDFSTAYGCAGTELPSGIAPPQFWCSVALPDIGAANAAHSAWMNSLPQT